MHKIIIILIMLINILLANTVTIYTEKRITGIYKNGEFIPNNTILENKGTWIINTKKKNFIHITNNNEVLHSTYWIHKNTITESSNVYKFIATSDTYPSKFKSSKKFFKYGLGNTRSFIFLKSVIMVNIGTDEEGNDKFILFPIINTTIP